MQIIYGRRCISCTMNVWTNVFSECSSAFISNRLLTNHGASTRIYTKWVRAIIIITLTYILQYFPYILHSILCFNMCTCVVIKYPAKCCNYTFISSPVAMACDVVLINDAGAFSFAVDADGEELSFFPRLSSFHSGFRYVRIYSMLCICCYVVYGKWCVCVISIATGHCHWEIPPGVVHIWVMRCWRYSTNRNGELCAAFIAIRCFGQVPRQ